MLILTLPALVRHSRAPLALLDGGALFDMPAVTDGLVVSDD